MPAGLYFKALAMPALIYETLGKDAYKTGTRIVFFMSKKKKKSPGTPQTCSPSPREDNQQDKSSLLLTLTPETDTTRGAHHPEGQQQEITPRSRLLEGAEKGTTFINNKLYHIYTQTH